MSKGSKDHTSDYEAYWEADYWKEKDAVTPVPMTAKEAKEKCDEYARSFVPTKKQWRNRKK